MQQEVSGSSLVMEGLNVTMVTSPMIMKCWETLRAGGEGIKMASIRISRGRLIHKGKGRIMG